MLSAVFRDVKVGQCFMSVTENDKYWKKISETRAIQVKISEVETDEENIFYPFHDTEEVLVKPLFDQFEFDKKVFELRKRYPSLRHGQAVFNATYILYPEEADLLRATSTDCFYKDSKIPEFLKSLQKLIG